MESLSHQSGAGFSLDAKQRFDPFTMEKCPVTMYLLKKKKRFGSFFLKIEQGKREHS